jgi:hypothetical protein
MLIAESKEEKPKVTYGAKSGICRYCLSTSEAQGKSGRDEINNYPICRLPRAAKVTVALKNVHRKTLMSQRFTYSCVNLFAETGDRRFRRRLQYERYNPGNHPGKGL